MNAKDRNRIAEAEKSGFTFRHLMGSKMMVSDGQFNNHIVTCTTSVEGYFKCLELIGF